MNILDLTKADFNQFYVTRNGYKVKLITNTSNFNTDIQYPIIGYLYSGGVWDNIPNIWAINGKFSKDIRDFDIIGVWKEKQPEVTVTFPAPIATLKDNQEYWTFCATDNGLGVASLNKFNPNWYKDRVENGLVFATKEDCQTWLDVMKGARR